MSHLKSILRIVSVALLTSLSAHLFAATLGTAFIYQGKLTDGGQAADGLYDLRFAIFDSTTNRTALAGPITNSPVGVTNGLFAVTLDFDVGVFAGDARWLEIAVRTNGGGDFATFPGRQLLAPSPAALYAAQAGSAVTVASNSVTELGLSTPALPAAGQVLTFTGRTLAWNTLETVRNGWLLSGNAGTTAGTHFLGTTDDQTLELRVNGQCALRLQPDGSSTPSVVGGDSRNSVASGVTGGTIGGGRGHAIRNGASFATISGGETNTVGNSAEHATIGGGHDNIVGTGFNLTIGGGGGNSIGSYADNSTIGGGVWNNIGSQAVYGTISGGSNNRIEGNARRSTIGGGCYNTVYFDTEGSVVAGGIGNTNQAYCATISGGSNNIVGSTASDASIGGGGWNSAAALFTTIAGGFTNRIEPNAPYATIGGGGHNTIQTGATNATIGGGGGNWIGSSGYAAIGSGVDNRIDSSDAAAIAGGEANEIKTSHHAVVAGGLSNSITITSFGSVIAGGIQNEIIGNSRLDAIGGGSHNLIVGIGAPAQNATIPGGENNMVGGSYGFAAGRRAKADGVGSFVWGDSNDFDIHAWGTNEFVARATGGFYFFTAVEANGYPANGAVLPAGSGSWSNWSDRKSKENVFPTDNRRILDRLMTVPVQTWNYRSQDKSIRHIGPMAQDFATAFGVGEDDKHITTVDADGVALAAIQGLNQKLEAAVKEKDARIAELERRLAALEQLVKAQTR